jgi:hypothetical protein
LTLACRVATSRPCRSASAMRDAIGADRAAFNPLNPGETRQVGWNQGVRRCRRTTPSASSKSKTAAAPAPSRRGRRAHYRVLVRRVGQGASCRLPATSQHRCETVDRHQVARRQTGLTTPDIIMIVRLYHEGCSLARIGHRFGVRPTSVRCRLQQSGVALRARNG